MAIMLYYYIIIKIHKYSTSLHGGWKSTSRDYSQVTQRGAHSKKVI